MLSLIDTLFQKEDSSSAYSYRNYQSREDYYHNLVREDSLNRLQLVFSRQQKACINADLHIQFRDIPFESSEKWITKRMGKARFEYDNSHCIKTHKILFYRTGISHFRAISQLHFLEDRFFFAKYIFRHTDSRDLNSILSVLQRKYFNTKQFADKISQVKDASHNTIMVEKSLHLNVGYLSGNPYFLTLITDLAQRKRSQDDDRHSQSIKSLEDYL